MTAPAKPTPGPWCLHDLSNRIEIQQDAPDRRLICILPFDCQEDYANAHLIAAAPDLADALRQVLPLAAKVLGEYIDAFTPPEGGYPPIEPDEQEAIDEAQAAVDVIRAALTKLEG